MEFAQDKMWGIGEGDIRSSASMLIAADMFTWMRSCTGKTGHGNGGCFYLHPAGGFDGACAAAANMCLKCVGVGHKRVVAVYSQAYDDHNMFRPLKLLAGGQAHPCFCPAKNSPIKISPEVSDVNWPRPWAYPPCKREGSAHGVRFGHNRF